MQHPIPRHHNNEIPPPSRQSCTQATAHASERSAPHIPKNTKNKTKNHTTIGQNNHHYSHPCTPLCYGTADNTSAGPALPSSSHNHHTNHHNITNTITVTYHKQVHSCNCTSHMALLAIPVLPGHGPTGQPAPPRMEHTGGFKQVGRRARRATHFSSALN